MTNAWPIVVARYHLGKRSKLAEILLFFKEKPQSYQYALDIGTGTGALALSYRACAASWDYLETNDWAASQAALILEQPVQRSWAEVEHKHYDLITIVDTFFYFAKPDETINNLEKMLNPGGKLLVTLTDSADRSWIGRLRNNLKLGQQARGFAFEESKEAFLQRFSSSSWQVYYFHSFSYLIEEAVLLFLDWCDQSTATQKSDQTKVDTLTNTSEAKRARLWLLRLAWPVLKLASLLDYPFRSFSTGHRYIVVFSKRQTG